jgi:transposase-like protein
MPKRLPTFTQDMDLPTLIADYGSEEKCRAYLEELRWPDGVTCPRCGSKRISRIKARGQFDCDADRYQFSVTSGTVLQDSHLPLWKWFLAAYVIGESKKGMSANQLKRMLGTSYKTAWYLSHRIRSAMHDENPEPLSGIVEADETYVGRNQRGGHGRQTGPNRTVVLGAVERKGRVRLRVTDRPSGPRIHAFLDENVEDADALFTDEWWAYRTALKGTPHGTVGHRKMQWVQGDVHTQTIESVWSLLKRSIIGSYHHLSVKHLDAYLDEMAFRYNNRENAYLFRDTLLRLIEADGMTYRELVEAV